MNETSWWLENIYGELVAGPFLTEQEARQAMTVIPSAEDVVPRMSPPKATK